jgi:hypothetical protein
MSTTRPQELRFLVLIHDAIRSSPLGGGASPFGRVFNLKRISRETLDLLIALITSLCGFNRRISRLCGS